MEKIKKAWKVFDENLILIYSFSVVISLWFAPNFWVVVIWFIYMGYSFYELLAEFVKNHRISVNVQIKEYLKNNGYTEDKEESEE